MARPREPIKLLEAKGRKHLSKAEIEELECYDKSRVAKRLKKI